MPFEIDVLNVGNADAIILRYIDKEQKEYVVLIDSGDFGHGEKIVTHIKKYTDKKSIDLAICTHPDNDHIGGFFGVVGKIPIKRFWIHDPSKNLIRTQKLVEASWGVDIEKSLTHVYESLTESTNLLSLIDKFKIPRDVQPFAGITALDMGIPLTVVGPSRSFYREQLDGFRGIDALYESIMNRKISSATELLIKAGKIDELFRIDRANDYGKENNSSVLLLFEPKNGNKYFFSADAGPKGLKLAMKDYDLTDLRWLKVPHHGSKRNITNAIIDELNPRVAYISCASDEQYPDGNVVGYLNEKGCEVFATCYSGNLWLSLAMPDRTEYTKATPIK